MKFSSALAIAGLAMPLVVHPLRADASPMQLNATTRSASVSSFAVEFDDMVGDGLLRPGEVTRFSGVDFPCDPGCSVFESTLLLVPAITGIAAGSGSSWGFGTAQSGGNLQATAAASLWRYDVQPAETSIPEPGTALLAILALAAQGVRRSQAGARATRDGQRLSPERTSVK